MLFAFAIPAGMEVLLLVLVVALLLTTMLKFLKRKK
jgi:hypothetical protein